ncbi:MAG TPA: HD-GYP domain-containing protein [Gaiellaceae bacterium]|nr:HD-GYP domain-containing protein [Gaiellaceae bacterium]
MSETVARVPLPAARRADAVLDPTVENAIGDRRARRALQLETREVLSALFIGGGFLVAAALFAIVAAGSERGPNLSVAVLLIGAYALAFTLDFEVVMGSFVPTQLILVPMLFVLPLGEVPLLVAGGILLGSLLDCLRGSLRLERVPLRLANGWHALGPALVLALAGEADPTMRSVPLYLGALVAQVGFDFASSAAYERLAGGVSPYRHLRAYGLPWLVDFSLSSVGLAIAFVASDNAYGVLLAVPLIVLLSVFARERHVHIDHVLELSSAYRGTAFLLGDVVEADDAYTGAHSRDVVALTLGVCDRLELSASERRDAEFAALLHDVGKVRIPKQIVNKPGPLTDEERAIMNTHTIEGERMLQKVGGLLGEIGAIVRSCHERWDGGGYPDGLAGSDIPLVARVVACCDAFNAMTTDRPYRAALPTEEAATEIERNRGTQFDPAVVEALLDVIRAQPA